MTPARPLRRAAVALVAAGALAGTLALAGCGAGASAASSSGQGSSAPASVSGTKKTYDGVNLPTPYHRPSFTLTDTAGAPYDFPTATKGRPTLLYFGYTHCPDVCPTTMADIAVALRGVGADLAKQVQVVFVTTDPAEDSPAVLAAWLGHFDRDLPVHFVGLTGTQPQIEQAQLSAGVPLAADEGKQHSALVLLYGADDKAHVAFSSANSPQDIQHDLRLVAAGS